VDQFGVIPAAGKPNIVGIRRMNMTISDFATKVKTSEKTVIRWINNGYIPGASVENNYIPDSARKPYTEDGAVPISRYMPVLPPAVSDTASNSRPAIRTIDRFCHQACIFPYSYPPFCNLEFLGFFYNHCIGKIFRNQMCE
jgi:hypothetical protein